MKHGYDNAAYYIDRAHESCVTGDSVHAADAAMAAATAVEFPGGGSHDVVAYATAAADALRERPADTERARRYLDLASRTVEELLAHGGAASVGAR